MVPIEMVDLKRQYKKIKNEINSAIQENLDNATFINGPANQLFASELASYLGIKHVIPNGNGTEALQIALMALGLQPGDEVLTPSFTYIATVEVIALLKLKPVFVDVDPDTFCIDPNLIEKAITSHTKAIIPVHLYGHPADMESILNIADKYGLPVIEDTAQAIGAEYVFSNGTVKKTGTMGTIGCTSFFPSKNLGCYGDGGAIFTDNDLLAAKIKMIANHGQKVRYYHEMIGCNSRLDTIQASVLRINLQHLDEYNNTRRANAAYYDAAFEHNPAITIPHQETNVHHTFHQYTLKFAENIDRNKIKEALLDKGIPSMIYYPVPCHRQQSLVKYCGEQPALPVTEWLGARVLSIPMHTELDATQLHYIASNVNELTEALVAVR